MKFSFLLMFITFIASQASSQDLEYAITFKNDTLYGKISIINFNQQQVIVKNGKEKTTLKVYQVQSLKTKKGIFRPLNIQGIYQFALLQQSGYLSYYKFSEDPNAPSLSFDTPLLVKSTGEQLIVPNLKFKLLTSRFLEDCQDVKENFNSGKYSRNKLELVIDDYNKCREAMASKTEKMEIVKEVILSKADQLVELTKMIESNSNIENEIEVLEMLSDVESKIKDGKNLPSYLIRILKENLSAHEELLERFELLLE